MLNACNREAPFEFTYKFLVYWIFSVLFHALPFHPTNALCSRQLNYGPTYRSQYPLRYSYG